MNKLLSLILSVLITISCGQPQNTQQTSETKQLALGCAAFGPGAPGCVLVAGGIQIIVGGVVVAFSSYIGNHIVTDQFGRQYTVRVSDNIDDTRPIEAARGNHADTGIRDEAYDMLDYGEAPDMCTALEYMMEDAKRFRNTSRMGKIKKTQKAFGCRHSRDF